MDFLIQSSITSSSKDTGHEERVCSDKRPFASLLTADGDVDDNDRGQRLFEVPLTDKLADSPPDFLTEFDQEKSNRGGDSMLNLSFSSLPFFSTILPGTHLEPTQPASAKTSDSFLIPPLSPGDEPPFHLPPTRQFQGSSLFRVGSYITLIFLYVFTLVSPVFSHQNPFGHSCQCLAAVTFAIEELEASCNSGNRSDLDSIVVYEKEAIKCYRSMLKCGTCIAKRENLVLLVFMAEKIVAACGQIVMLYRVKNDDIQASSVPSSLLGCSPLDRLPLCVGIEDRDFLTSASSSSYKTESTHSSSITSICTGTSSGLQELYLDDYQVNSLLEWEHVVRVLIFLQLKEVMELLTDMKKTSSKSLGETQMAGLVQAEIKADKLKKDICTI